MQELAQSLNTFNGLWRISGVCIALLLAAAVFFRLCGKKDRICSMLVALAFMELSGVFLFMTLGLEDYGGESSSKLMPFLWGIPLFLMSAFQLVRLWCAPRADTVKYGRLDKVVLTFIVVALAISQFRRLGFFVSTSAMLVLLMLLLGERRPLLICGTVCAWLLFTWLVLNKLLMLGLPTGTLFVSFFA